LTTEKLGLRYVDFLYLEMDRRNALKTTLTAAAAISFPHFIGASGPDFQPTSLMACQQYTVFSFLQREGIDWTTQTRKTFKDLQGHNVLGFEPSFETSDQVDIMTRAMEKEGIWSRSMYVNSLLHDQQKAAESINYAVAIAKQAKKAGIEIVVTNPQPIEWGKPYDKDDQQLRHQARNLNELGRQLRKLGMKLAYHTHDVEMRQGAREFHHMLNACDPENVHLCLDAHWVYRGAGNSEVALFDIVKLYGSRIVELHIRQSVNGVWSEVFGQGDIDYSRLAETLKSMSIKPHLVFEQAAEDGTPKTMGGIQAIATGFQNSAALFT